MTRWLWILMVTVGGLAGCATEAPPIHEREMIDLTYALDADTIYWPTEDGFALDSRFAGFTERGYYYTANGFSAPEHGGTHIDAPGHFVLGESLVDELDPASFIAPIVVIDITAKAAAVFPRAPAWS